MNIKEAVERFERSEVLVALLDIYPRSEVFAAFARLQDEEATARFLVHHRPRGVAIPTPEEVRIARGER